MQPFHAERSEHENRCMKRLQCPHTVQLFTSSIRTDSLNPSQNNENIQLSVVLDGEQGHRFEVALS